jgi:hypothetical protein
MADTKISALTPATTPLAGTEVLPLVQSGVTKKVSVADLTAGRDVSMRELTSRKDQDAITQMILSNQFVNANGSGVSYDFYYGTTRLGGLKHAFDAVGAYFDLQVWDGAAPATRQRTYSTGGGVWGTGTDPGAGNYKIENGNLVIGTSGKGIDFSATPGTGTSELLADYEEGTFTPAVTFGGGSTGVTYSAFNEGKYTKVGRIVTVCGILDLTNKGSSSGTAVITGLPFVGSAFGGATLTLYGLTFTGQAYGQPNSNQMVLYQVSAGIRTALTDTAFQNDTSLAFQITYYV